MKKTVIGAVIGCVCVLCVSCGYLLREPLRVGVFPRPGCEIIWVAKHNGYFEDEGLDVIVSQYSSWESTVQSFNKGKTDLSVETLLSYLVSGHKGRIIAITDKFKGDVLVGKKSLKTVKDIVRHKEKPIAVEKGTDGYYYLQSLIQKTPGAQKSVHVNFQPTDEAVDSFVRGDVNAVFCYPPYLAKALKKGQGRILFSQEFSSISPRSVIVASEQSFLLRKKDINKFLRAWFRAVDFLKKRPKEAIKIMAAAEGVTPDEFSECLSDLKVYDRNESETIMTTNKITEIINALNYMLKKQGVHIGQTHVHELIDTGFVRRKK